MAEALTFSAYAKRIGVSQPYVSKLVAKGVIPLTAERKIDPDAADAALAAIRDPSKQAVADRHAAARDKPEQQTQPIGGAPQGQFHKAKTLTEVFRAKHAQLEYERATGRLVEADRVVRAIEANVAPTVKLLDGIPDRLASRLAAETDPRKVHGMLSSEINTVKAEVARVARLLVEQLATSQQ